MLDTTSEVLHALLDRLHARGVKATGPHRGVPSPECDYLDLTDGRHVRVWLDSNAYWQALIYEDGTLSRMADVDATGWPGDPV